MESLLKMRQQRGYLLILAVMIIIIVGFVGAILVNMFIGGTNAEHNTALANQALYVARSGMEIAKRDVVVNRIACGEINGMSKYTEVNFANGQFTVTGIAKAATAILDENIREDEVFSGNHELALNGASGFAVNGGAIKIDNEIFYYTSINNNVLQNVKRAVSGSIAAAHEIGANVVQDQCILTSVGVVPRMQAVSAKRVVKEVLSTGSYGGFHFNGMKPLLAVAGNVVMSGNSSVNNPMVWYNPEPGSPDYFGSTVVAAGTVTFNGGAANTKVCGCDTSNCLAACVENKGLVVSSNKNISRKDVAASYKEISSDNLFDKVFSMPKAQMKNYVQSSAPSSVQYFASSQSIKNLHGIVGKTIWIDGSLVADGNDKAVVGTQEKPVILIVTGNFNMAGTADFTFHGLLYVMGNYDFGGNSTLDGKGIYAAEGNVVLRGSSEMDLNSIVVESLNGINPFLRNGYLGKAANAEEV